MLSITAFIWGSAFVAQKDGMRYIGPFTFTASRMLLGGFVLIPVIFLLRRLEAKTVPGRELTDAEAALETLNEMPEMSQKSLLIGGAVCGFVLYFACAAQQIGLLHTTAGKAGFITSLYILLVPLLGLFLGNKVRRILWFCVALGVLGLYFLCVLEDFTIGRGDFIMLFSALGFAFHILAINYFAPKVNGVQMSCLQFFVCGILSLATSLAIESPELHNILISWFPIVYAGAISCGIAYTFQILGQKHTDPTVASLILSLESVFAVICGILILNEALSLREFAGCALMLAAIVLAQLPGKNAAKDGAPQLSN